MHEHAVLPLQAHDIPVQISSLPKGLLEELAVATDSCDADEIDRIISEIHTHNGQLGDALMLLSRKFAYQEIMGLIEIARKS